MVDLSATSREAVSAPAELAPPPQYVVVLLDSPGCRFLRRVGDVPRFDYRGTRAVVRLPRADTPTPAGSRLLRRPEARALLASRAWRYGGDDSHATRLLLAGRLRPAILRRKLVENRLHYQRNTAHAEFMRRESRRALVGTDKLQRS